MSSVAHPRRGRTIVLSLGKPRRLEMSRVAEHQLRCSGYLALRGISCSVQDGIVHLSGCLPSYYLKQVAQTVVSEVEGIRGIDNRIEVVAPASRSAFEPARLTAQACVALTE